MQSQHVIIFAHGKRTGNTFASPAAQNFIFYIDQDHTFNFSPESFGYAFQGKLAPKHPVVAGGVIDDHTLKKAAEGHVDPPVARKYYADLVSGTNNSDNYVNALAPLPFGNIAGHGNGLGLGVPCDILSVRNRIYPHMRRLTLSDLLQDAQMAQYTFVHGFFCRARPFGTTVHGQAPRKIR